MEIYIKYISYRYDDMTHYAQIFFCHKQKNKKYV